MLKNQSIASLNKVIDVGSSASIMFEEGEIVNIKIKTPTEVDLANAVISNESPLGSALLGKKEGDIFCYSVEEKVFKGTVLGINSGSSDPL